MRSEQLEIDASPVLFPVTEAGRIRPLSTTDFAWLFFLRGILPQGIIVLFVVFELPRLPGIAGLRGGNGEPVGTGLQRSAAMVWHVGSMPESF